MDAKVIRGKVGDRWLSSGHAAGHGDLSAARDVARSSVLRWRIAALLGSLSFALVWTLALGRDVHWDAVNYHLYSGFSALVDRFALDFFGAGTPSYVNPYANVPLYLMWRADWPALWMAMALASLHGLILWLTFEIALVAGLRADRLQLHAFAFVAMLVAATNPVLLQGLGSTMTDLSIGVLVVAGWLAIVVELRHGGRWPAAVAGLLCGVGAALKLSNVVFAIAAVPALLFTRGSVGLRAATIATFGAACSLAFLVSSMPWSWYLWREFGNPFFPFLNQLFLSPDFTTVPIRQERFVPLGFQEFLLRPIDMLAARSAVHVEPRAPDLRYATLLAALLAWGLARIVRGAHPRLAPGGSDEVAGAGRSLGGLFAGLAAAWCLWLIISGNSRYFLPMACLASVVLVLVIQRIHATWPLAAVGFGALAFTTQIVQLALGSDLRRGGRAWEGPWLSVEIPERLRSQPFLFLSPSFQSGSAFAPYLHSRSGMINVGGFNAIGPGHPGGGRALELVNNNADRLRFLLPLPRGAVQRGTVPTAPAPMHAYFRRFGLRVDGGDCEFMRIEGNLRGEDLPPEEPWKSFLTCRLVLAPELRVAYEREAAQVDPIFDRVEDACPKLFFPRRPVTQEYHYWVRTYYVGSEMQLFIDEGRVKYYFYLRGGDPVDLGPVESWREGPQPVDCSIRTNPAFRNSAR